jgi:hypothetical protein
MVSSLFSRERLRSLGLVTVAATSSLSLALFVNAPMGLLAAPAPAMQLPAGEVEVEGPLTAVDPLADTITIMGIVINVPPGTPIATPTAVGITLDDLVGFTLPGRGGLDGFLGGTGIVLGTTGPGGVVADDVFVEPAENVILGAVTENTIPAGGSLGDGTFSILGVPLLPIDHPTLPLVATLEGFEVDLATVPVGSLAVVEGFFGLDGNMYATIIETTAGQPVGDPNQTSIFLAKCKPTGRLEVRGTSTTPGTVTMLGFTQDVEFDPVTNLGEFRFKINTPLLPGGVCPTSVTVFNSNGSSATSAVEIIG